MAGAPYTAAEDKLIASLRRRGFTWVAVAERMPGRTASGVESRAYYLAKPRPGGRRDKMEGVILTHLMDKPEGDDDAYVQACLKLGGFPVLDIAKFRRAA